MLPCPLWSHCSGRVLQDRDRFRAGCGAEGLLGCTCKSPGEPGPDPPEANEMRTSRTGPGNSSSPPLSRCFWYIPRLTIRADDRVELFARKTHTRTELSYTLSTCPYFSEAFCGPFPRRCRPRLSGFVNMGCQSLFLRHHVQAGIGNFNSLPRVLPPGHVTQAALREAVW